MINATVKYYDLFTMLFMLCVLPISVSIEQFLTLCSYKQCSRTQAFDTWKAAYETVVVDSRDSLPGSAWPARAATRAQRSRVRHRHDQEAQTRDQVQPLDPSQSSEPPFGLFDSCVRSISPSPTFWSAGLITRNFQSMRSKSPEIAVSRIPTAELFEWLWVCECYTYVVCNLKIMQIQTKLFDADFTNLDKCFALFKIKLYALFDNFCETRSCR